MNKFAIHSAYKKAMDIYQSVYLFPIVVDRGYHKHSLNSCWVEDKDIVRQLRRSIGEKLYHVGGWNPWKTEETGVL